MTTFTVIVLACSLATTPDVSKCTEDSALQAVKMLKAPECDTKQAIEAAIEKMRPIVPGEDVIRVLCAPG